MTPCIIKVSLLIAFTFLKNLEFRGWNREYFTGMSLLILRKNGFEYLTYWYGNWLLNGAFLRISSADVSAAQSNKLKLSKCTFSIIYQNSIEIALEILNLVLFVCYDIEMVIFSFSQYLLLLCTKNIDFFCNILSILQTGVDKLPKCTRVREKLLKITLLGKN